MNIERQLIPRIIFKMNVLREAVQHTLEVKRIVSGQVSLNKGFFFGIDHFYVRNGLDSHGSFDMRMWVVID